MQPHADFRPAAAESLFVVESNSSSMVENFVKENGCIWVSKGVVDWAWFTCMILQSTACEKFCATTLCGFWFQRTAVPKQKKWKTSFSRNVPGISCHSQQGWSICKRHPHVIRGLRIKCHQPKSLKDQMSSCKRHRQAHASLCVSVEGPTDHCSLHGTTEK